MSKVLRRSKTKEKVSAQYGVADPDPADLDVRQTRNRQYPAAPPITGGTWRDRANIRERSESPIFISTTPDSMSTDEAIEISKKIDQEIAQEEADKGQTEEKAILGADDTLPTVEELQTPKSAEELYEEIKEELGPSGVVSFPKYEKELLGKAVKEKEKVDQGIRAPLITSAEGEKLFEIKQIPPLTYGDLPDFDKIVKEGDEFIEQTYSMMSDLEKEEANSQSFVILHRGEKEVSSNIYENITQDLKEIMPNEVYLPTSAKRKDSERQPKVWVKRTPFESNPAIVVQIEEWLDTVGTRDFTVDVKLGIMYAIKGYKWQRMTEKAEIRSESVQEGTPVIGPIGGSVKTPTSKEPIPLAESTRKDGPIYTNTSIEEKSKDAKPPERKNKQRSDPQYTKPIETPRRKLTFQEEDGDAKEIQKEIEEVQRAEEALTLQREKIEMERIEILKKQQEATKERLVTMRQQRKRLEESIAQMGKEMAQDSQISYKDRLTRRQNLENEYGNQIERESEMVQDFIDLLDKKEEITMDTMTTDSALSSTADPIEFMDEATVMKIKIKHIRAMECKNRSLKMYKHFIQKAKELKNTKEQEELENLLLASIKSLDRKLVKYKRALDSYDEREQLYFTTLAKNSRESEENRQKKEEASLRKRHLEVRKELAKMQNEAKMAEERKKAMKAKVREEKVKQIDKLQKLAEEQERLQRLQKQKAEEALTAAFLLREKKQQAVEEEKLTKEFLKKEKEKEELKQKKLTEQFLEQERIKEEKKQRQLTEQLLERERLEKERMQKNKTAKYTKTSGISPTRPDAKRKTTKPTTTEQEAERQKLFSALNDVVLNGKKPGKGKDLRWDYEKDKKAQAIFGKIRKHNREPVDMCPKCETLQHEGQCPCPMCGKRGHDEKSCPSQSPPTKKRKEKSEKKKGVCTCCNSEGHRAQECPWNKTESMEQESIVPEFENLRPTICTHCRALDHLIEDCPSLKSADERRREVQCGRCGKMGHDITACLDETQLKKERDMEEALKQKQKELERINRRMRDLRQSKDKIDEPIDKDTNSPPTHQKKIPSKRGTSGHPKGGKEMNLLKSLNSHWVENQELQVGVPQMIQEDQMMEMMVMMRMMKRKKRLMRKMRK